MVLIVLSTITVILESVASVRFEAPGLFNSLEWAFTILFTIEYALRFISLKKPLTYSRSFYGIVDFLAIIPAYLGLIFAGTGFLLTFRVLRLLRVFRILKLVEYVSEAQMLKRALAASRRKVSVFLFTIALSVLIIAALMYVIEGEENGFVSIPTSMYWTIVTLTTVGYGDIAPQTPFGKILASMVMLLGYSIIAVPTGIVTAEMTRSVVSSKQVNQKKCLSCGGTDHDNNAVYCKYCGSRL